MLQVTLVCVGKCKEPYLRQAVLEYQKRLGAFCKWEIQEVSECRCDKPTPALIEKTLQREGEGILKRIPERSYTVALCIEGEQVSSNDLAASLQTWTTQGISRLCFIIGGSYGLSREVKQAADWKLSLSSMTFPHQLTRVILMEQLYRGFTILQTSPYHK